MNINHLFFIKIVSLIFFILLWNVETPNFSTFIIIFSIYLFAIIYFVYKVDYLNIFVAFCAPWILIILFSTQDISEYSKSLDQKTFLVIFFGLLTAFLISSPTNVAIRRTEKISEIASINPSSDNYNLLYAALILLAGTNAVASGYIPLLSLTQSGDSGYLDFGINGVYGLYNAFANAFGVASFYLWLQTRNKNYIYGLVTCLIIFTFFVSRQNIMSLFFECFIVYCFLRGKPSFWKLISLALIALLIFSYLGNKRISGSISDLAMIKDEFAWTPDFVVWVFSYSYFNAANLDNLVSLNLLPDFNGASLQQLIPSFLRPDFSEDFVDLAFDQMTVKSYIYPIYKDFGLAGVAILVGIATKSADIYLKRVRREPSLQNVGIYATLLFCAFFSFFVNFWFYLPIIFQAPLFLFFQRFLLQDHRIQHKEAIDHGRE